MIIYFTGTGNSKYIAETLAKQLNDDTVNASYLIKKGEHPSFSSEKPYVFVSPVYAWRMPRLFEKWMEKCEFTGSKNAYFILTCGDDIGAADNYIEKFVRKLNLNYMGTAQVIMPENYIVMFSVPSIEEDEAIINKATARTAELGDLISAQKSFGKKKNTFLGHLCSDIVTPFFYKFYIGAKKFYTTDKCIYCGKCVKNCMLNNIELKDGKLIWGNDCTHCMACICKCPTEAIEYGKHTRGLRRYICPKA